MYCILWRFCLRKGKKHEFESHYSSAGSWVRLFRRSPDFVQTLLLKEGNATYVTIDIWKNAGAFRRFKAKHMKEYEALDRKCESLTETETLIGKFRAL